MDTYMMKDGQNVIESTPMNIFVFIKKKKKKKI